MFTFIYLRAGPYIPIMHLFDPMRNNMQIRCKNKGGNALNARAINIWK